MIIDTHSHCYWPTLLPRIEEVVSTMKSNNIEKAIQIGCDMETSKEAIALAKRFPSIFYATVGYHPEEAQDIEFDQTIIDEFEALIQENREYIVGIGETGFDFHYIDGTEGGTKKLILRISQRRQKPRSKIRKNGGWRSGNSAKNTICLSSSILVMRVMPLSNIWSKITSIDVWCIVFLRILTLLRIYWISLMRYIFLSQEFWLIKNPKQFRRLLEIFLFIVSLSRRMHPFSRHRQFVERWTNLQIRDTLSRNS